MEVKAVISGSVRLFAPRDGDAEALLHLHDEEATKRFSFFREPLTLERELAYLREKSASTTDCLWVVTKADIGEILGTCGLHEIDFVCQTARLGILLINSRFHGKGFGSAALLAITEYAFTELGLHKVYLNVIYTNSRARALYERLGFRSEGILRAEYRLGNERLDMVRMSMLKSDWEKAEAQKALLL